MKTILKKFATFLCAALVLCACSDDDYSEAHQSLMALIRQAESLVEESTEGIEEGDTAPGSKKALQARIDQAYYIMHNTSRDEGYRNACKQLEEAIKAFRENIVKAGIPYFNAGSKMNLGPAGDWDLTEELTWEMKIRFDEFAAGDQAIAFQPLQGLRQHLLADPADPPAQATETLGAFGQHQQHQHAPAAGDMPQHVARRALRGQQVAATQAAGQGIGMQGVGHHTYLGVRTYEK